MNQSIECLETVADRNSNLLCENVYGYRKGIFDGSIRFEEQQRGVPEIPLITRSEGASQLTLSEEGRQKWNRTLERGSAEIGLDPDDLYVASGIALLELANIVNYSVSNKDIIPRLRMIDKVFRKDNSPSYIGFDLTEKTGVNMDSIVSGLDQDDFMLVSRLRYGLGVALKAYGVEQKQVEIFSSINLDEAANSIIQYSHGIATYLSGVENIGEIDRGHTSSKEITSRIFSVEFPYLEVAASNPMNVSMLLNK